jgi:hypothetical protein
MQLDLSEEDLELVVKALDHYHAYTVAKRVEDSRYEELAARLRRKPTEREEPAQRAKAIKRRA